MNKRRRYFGTDGIRGFVGKMPMTPDFLVRLGFVVGQVLAKNQPRRVIIGKDTRRSGYMVESALEAGLSAAGVEVLLTGPLPTSGISYLTQAMRLSAGIIISASHNPHHDNGVKFFSADGAKLADDIQDDIENLLMDRSNLDFEGEPGQAKRLDGATSRYVEFCKRSFPRHFNLKGMRVLVDCANGAAYKAAPIVFHELGAEVIEIGNQPDGQNINVDCGVLASNQAITAVCDCGADLGIVLDGDADRILLIDEGGKRCNGDALLYLIAKSAYERGQSLLGVVGTVLSNDILRQCLYRLGIDFYRANVGDRYVNEAMINRGWSVGGEPSGHILLHDFHCTGDGIIAALQALRVMCETNSSLSDLLSDFQPLPQIRRDILAVNPSQVLQQSSIKAMIDEYQQQCGESMRLVIRPSGTESMIRIMAEGQDVSQLEEVIDYLTTQITNYIGNISARQ